MEIVLFFTGISAIIYMSYKLGKDRGTMLASERAVDIMIAMGYLKERANGEIEKVDNEKSNWSKKSTYSWQKCMELR